MTGIPLRDRRHDVISLGEALVDFLPSRRGPLADVPSFERHPGGAPANVAVGVARLGARSVFVGTVGDDPFGAYLRAALAKEGVDAARLHAAKGQRTGLAFVSLDERGAPRFFAAGGSAEIALAPEHVAGAPFPDARAFHFSTGLVRSASARAATFEAVDRARAAGCLVAFDPNLRLHHWADTAPLARDVEALLAKADVVKLSSDEIAFVAGTTDAAEAARRICARGPRLAIVTTGATGCTWARRTDGSLEEGRVPTRVAAVVDTTGAGDAFQATVLTLFARRLAAGEDPIAIDRTRLERALAIAAEAGTRVCERMGAVAGLPTAAELGSLDV